MQSRPGVPVSERENELDQRSLVIFALIGGYQEANLRHYASGLEDLREVREALKEGGVRFM